MGFALVFLLEKGGDHGAEWLMDLLSVVQVTSVSEPHRCSWGLCAPAPRSACTTRLLPCGPRVY